MSQVEHERVVKKGGLKGWLLAGILIGTNAASVGAATYYHNEIKPEPAVVRQLEWRYPRNGEEFVQRYDEVWEELKKRKRLQNYNTPDEKILENPTHLSFDITNEYGHTLTYHFIKGYLSMVRQAYRDLNVKVRDQEGVLLSEEQITLADNNLANHSFYDNQGNVYQTSQANEETWKDLGEVLREGFNESVVQFYKVKQNSIASKGSN